MSLMKSYRLSCEGTDLHIRRELNATGEYETGKPARRRLRDACAFATREAGSSKEARSVAVKAGWVRHSETMPIYRGATDTTVVKYDLCPNCAGELVADGKGTRYAAPGPTCTRADCDSPRSCTHTITEGADQ